MSLINQYSEKIDDMIFTKSVSKYLGHNKKTEKKYNELFPKCFQIFNQEIGKIPWMDECVKNYLFEMLNGAHISQLNNFYNQYKNTTNKTAFFQRWVRDEL